MSLHLKKGFTLVEMLLAAAIVAFAVCGILALYISCVDFIATSKNIGISTNAAQGLMEQIRATPFPQIKNNYDHLNFIVNNMPLNRGIVYVNDTDPELLNITISVSWRQGNRTIGEDKNLNGVINTGEDVNSNGILDSTVEIVTLKSNR